MGNLKNLCGEKFGRLKVVSLKNKRIGNTSLWECICDCGKFVNVRACNLKSGHSTSCGCFRFQEQWKGFGEIPGNYWSSIQRRCKRLKREINIDIEYAWNLFLEQKRQCALTKLPLTFHSNWRHNKEKNTASLDRINSNLGYIKGNVQWIHKELQIMKNKYGQEKFISYCRLVAENFTNPRLKLDL